MDKQSTIFYYKYVPITAMGVPGGSVVKRIRLAVLMVKNPPA